MADLSGQYIKGTGSYKIPQVAPPVESGQLLNNNKFLNWTADNPDDWTVTAAEDATNYVTEVSGKCRLVSDGTTIGIRQGVCVIGRSYKMVVSVTALATGTAKINGVALVYGQLASVGITTVYFVADHANLTIQRNPGGCDITMDWVTLEEVPEGYPLMDEGDTYLQCTTIGVASILSDQAFGEWEWSMYKALDANLARIHPIATEPKIFSDSSQNGYLFQFDNAETVQLYRITAGGVTALFQTVTSYIAINTWYRIKFTRTLDGEFSFYIMGGTFGTTDWTLIVETSGGNPVTNIDHIISKYFVLDFDAGDRIANIVMRKGVKQ